jgi:6-phosphogluconolactonase (cycloisomerase 2 family)
MAALMLTAPAPAPAAVGDLSFGECVSSVNTGGDCATLPFNRLDQVFEIELSPDGDSLYASARGDDSVSRFGVGPAGALTFADCVSNTGSSGACADLPGAAFDDPGDLEMSPGGNSLYVVAAESDSVTHFGAAAAGGLTYAGCVSETGSGGTCASVPGTSFDFPVDVAMSPQADALYVAAFGSSSVTRFTASPAGQLTYFGCAANENSAGSCVDDLLPTFQNPDSLAVSRDGAFVYANGTSGADSVASLNTTNLERVDCVSDNGTLGVCENAPGDSFDAPRNLLMDPSGTRMYALSQAGSIIRLDLGAGGQLAFAGCESAVSSGGACEDNPGGPFSQPTSAAFSPDGSSLYVGSLSTQSVSHFSVAADGGLTFRSCVSNDGSGGCTNLPGNVLLTPNDIEVSPDGRSVFVAGVASDSVVRLDRELPDTDPPGLTLTAKRAKAGKPVKVTVACDEACTVELSGTAKPQGSKRGKLGAKTAELTSAGSATLTLKPKGKLKRRLKDAGKGKASVSATATDAAGNEADASRKVKLK